MPPSNAAAIRAGRGAAITPAAYLGAALLFGVTAADLPDARAADGPVEITDQARRLKALEQSVVMAREESFGEGRKHDFPDCGPGGPPTGRGREREIETGASSVNEGGSCF